MRNYWYVSLSNRYPQPSTNDPPRVIQSVQMKSKYSIVEMTREAEPDEIDACKQLNSASNMKVLIEADLMLKNIEDT